MIDRLCKDEHLTREFVTDIWKHHIPNICVYIYIIYIYLKCNWRFAKFNLLYTCTCIPMEQKGIFNHHMTKDVGILAVSKKKYVLINFIFNNKQESLQGDSFPRYLIIKSKISSQNIFYWCTSNVSNQGNIYCNHFICLMTFQLESKLLKTNEY